LSELLELARSGARIVEEVLRYGVLLAGDRGVVEELSRARGREPRPAATPAVRRRA